MASTLELTIDVTRVVAMLLVHDVGEIDAGDKYRRVVNKRSEYLSIACGARRMGYACQD